MFFLHSISVCVCVCVYEKKCTLAEMPLLLVCVCRQTGFQCNLNVPAVSGTEASNWTTLTFAGMFTRCLMCYS